jgi:hypothetical protein
LFLPALRPAAAKKFIKHITSSQIED